MCRKSTVESTKATSPQIISYRIVGLLSSYKSKEYIVNQKKIPRKKKLSKGEKDPICSFLANVSKL